MSTYVPWIRPRIYRTLFLIFCINAGALTGNFFAGELGARLGAFAGFVFAIKKPLPHLDKLCL